MLLGSKKIGEDINRVLQRVSDIEASIG